MNLDLPTYPSEEIRKSYDKISSLAKESPVVITLDGKEDAVLISYEYFTKQSQRISDLEAKLGIYAYLAQGMKDAKLGRASDLEEAFDDVLKSPESLDS